MLEIKNLRFSYGEKNIIDNFSLTVPDGKCVCLTGTSGCGKTTVLRLLAGLEAPENGTVSAPKKLSVVFQEDRLVPHMSIMKNIMLCLPKDKKALAEALLKEAGLEEAKNKKPDELSGGMKRRAAIVRAVAFGGDALLLDEAFNGLDSETKAVMANMIKREFTAKSKPVLMVSHIAEDSELMNAEQVEMTVEQ